MSGEGEKRPVILVVDDAPDMLSMLSAVLEKAGMTTLVAADGERALAVLAHIVPDLILLDALMPRVDFVSVGSNDLMQYFFAADRNNTLVADRYDALSAAPLRALGAIAEAARRHNRPLSLCGEMAGRPLEAMALIGLGYRSISMSPASIGPIKSMVLTLDVGALERWLEANLRASVGSLREGLQQFAQEQGVEI